MDATKKTTPSILRFSALALWLGIVGFGGGYAITNRIRHTLVEKFQWLSLDEFLQCFGVSNAMPGTASTNLVTILGLRFGGTLGAVVAPAVFLLPSVALMIAFGAAYPLLRDITSLSRFLDGMSVATVGVVAAVAVDMGRAAIRKKRDATIAIFAVTALVTRVLTLVEVIAISAVFGALALRPRSAPDKPQDFPPASLPAFALPAWIAALAPQLALLLVFARIGLVTFGGGYAMIPAIEREVVATHGWLSAPAFNDAMVLGQITPGPVAIAATFIGMRVGGVPGALLATIGMFGPPWILTVLAGRSMAAFRSNSVVQGALHGVAPAVVGVIAAAAVALFRTAIHAWPGAIVAAIACAVLVVFRRLSPIVVLAIAGALALLLPI